jgi:hypothetical protein
VTINYSKLLVPAVAVAAIVAAWGSTGEAHKAITSPFTYNEDVFPILKAKCGACHVKGGIAPMSLMTYQDAFPWAESMRAELIAMHMPPWNAEGGFGSLRHPQVLTPKEINVILTWATGGNPEGDRTKAPPEVTLSKDWPLGKPDLVVKLPEPVTVPADTSDTTHEFTVALKNAKAQWVRAIDLLPDNAVMVRSATIALKGSDEDGVDTVITDWLPGGTLQPMADGLGYELPPNAELSVNVRYKKTWQYDGQELTDQSSIGVYYAKAAGAPLHALAMASDPLQDGEKKVEFSKTLDHDVEAVALRPGHVPPHGGMQVEAVLPNGTHTPLIRLNTQPEWPRRYWFAKPVALPKGTTIQVTTSVDIPFTLQMPDLLAPPEPPMSMDPLTLTLDYTPKGAVKASAQ